MNLDINAVQAEMNRGRWSAKNKDLRRAYWTSREDVRRVLVRNGVWAGLIVYLSFSILDAVIVPDAAALTIAGRFIATFISLSAVEFGYRRRQSADHMDMTVAVCLFLCFFLWIWAAGYSSHTALFGPYIIFGNIFMTGATLFFAFRVRLAVIVCTAMCLVMMHAVVWKAGYADKHVILYVCFNLSCFLFSLVVNMRMDEERYRTFLSELAASFHQKAEADRGKELLRQSMTDYLTGVENRRSLDAGLQDYWNQWKEHSAAFVVALIDVDHFKKFNDGYGHINGDECLKNVASIIAGVVQKRGGRVGRYGGEEFMAIAHVIGDADAVAFGSNLRSAIEAHRIDHAYRMDGTPFVTVSIGLGCLGIRSAKKVESLVAEADLALYAAKESGRNAVVLYDPNDPLHNDASEEISGVLKQALNQALLSLAYQPIVNVSTGAVEGFEALMRLQTPEGKSISPAEFIPVAEQTGAIVPLGRWAIHTVCRDLLAPGIVPLVSVNVSAIQLKMQGFSMQVAGILMETGVPGHRLALEITEGLQLEIDATVLRTIGELKELGVRIWLDDFGTGFAGLSWLRTIDFDKVKIDKSFLYDADRPEGRRMLEDIITLVRRRGATILVEGVETQAQLDFTRRSGVDEVQGYHLGRPGPIDGLRSIQAPVQAIEALKVVGSVTPFPTRLRDNG